MTCFNHTGSIKSDPRGGYVQVQRFQFHTGSIKSDPRGGYVQVQPYWFD
jgi:hypothetical protein